MKKEIQIFKIPPRRNIKGMLRGILNIDEIIEKLVNDGDDFYFLYEKVNNKMFYGIYTIKELNNKISGFEKYIKPFKELSALVDKIYNETYGFNRLVETTIKHEIFCTSINVNFFNKELRKLLNKVDINFNINPNFLEEYVSFNVNNKTFAKFSTRGNYEKTKKFKVESKIFVEAVKRVLEEYYDTNIRLNKMLKVGNIETKGNKMQNKENLGSTFSTLKGAISEDLHNEGFSTAKISTILGMYENSLKFGQNARLDGFEKEERISIINIYDKYFKEDSIEDSIEDKGNEIFGNNESLKKEDYFLISEIDGVQKLLPKTFETIDEVENYIKEYLSDPSRIGMIVHILKKDKSVISEIQIKELTDG